ncbi:MAG: hypothetical protein ACM3U1_08825 [Chloroflexota bacterium]
MRKLLLLALLNLFFIPCLLLSQVSVIPTDSTQKDFLRAYRLAALESDQDYRFTGANYDKTLFPEFSESSVYWVSSGENRGAFVVAAAVRSDYSSITSNPASNYDWRAASHLSIQFKNYAKRVAIFSSSVALNNNTVSWEAIYFKNSFDSYLADNISYYVDEKALDTTDIDYGTTFLIIPSLSLSGSNYGFYADSISKKYPKMADRLKKFLAGGGTVYAEGTGGLLLEKLGILPAGTFDYSRLSQANAASLHEINFRPTQNPIAFTSGATGNNLYGVAIPSVNPGKAEVIAEKAGFSPVVISLTGAEAFGGKIVCNTGLPTVGGFNELKKGSRQLTWLFNTFFGAHAGGLDVTRSVYNDLPDSITAGKNAIGYDVEDEFEVRLKLRNLTDQKISAIKLTESLQRAQIDGKWKNYFNFAGVVTPDVDYEIVENNLIFKDIFVLPKTEIEIVYKLKTPADTSTMRGFVDKFLAWKNYAYASVNTTEYSDPLGAHRFNKYRNYVDFMFSAFLAADADLNWKNFLGIYYQPFRVFMIMENKERTSAENVVYTQYIPKDVPFYWSDRIINMPILKTPGGKFIDVMRGSNDQNNPEYDFDSDGKPDVWLDTASIYPKNYTITEEEVYWLNPWEHLRTGNKFYYEDIDHDGLRAQDTDGDGKVDIEEPGDKIRVWKVTWNINRVAGYDYADPYCYYDIWVDPPDLPGLSAGVGYVNGTCDSLTGMIYPYTKDISKADKNDPHWKYWMETDDQNRPIWKQYIFQRINNYEGYTYIDTAATGYKLKPTDYCAGTVPQPHNEFIAVLSLGGEEIDMRHVRPQQSLYSKLDYKTIFNESRTTPIRSTYTYYAPLPNPMQFEYLSNNYLIKDMNSGDTLKYLPKWGKAKLEFDMDASTEYSYYWIRNAGHDVDYNDPSEAQEKNEKLGDGVFGYMIYDLPKGIGGYKIDLPRKSDGSYDIDNILQVDGKPFVKWLENKWTANAPEIWEDAFQYHIYVPQLLIPPAIDDDNRDGIDDWIDDRGDRFQSSTGFLHDGFMLGDGEEYKDYPKEPFIDDIYGQVKSGWYEGGDGTRGDDFFENLGKTHFKINAIYEGRGKEGLVDISKGGWLVVEEIFGGSPWVIFSHTLNGYSQGVDFALTAQSNPSLIKFGRDTTYIKHILEDRGEPHYFNADFDPWYVSYGVGEATVTTYLGGKDPCSLISPPIDMPASIDPTKDINTITLIPNADKDNPDLKDYPKTVSGTFAEIKIEVMNGTDDNWLNTKVEPQLPASLGASEIVMSYVAYPRPLVPAKVDPATGEIIQGGDDPGAFRAGWRFNQPEGEVLVKAGNILPLLQPSRRAYFIFLVKIDPSLPKDVYEIDFALNTLRKNYKSAEGKNYTREVPPAKFQITTKNDNRIPTDYQKFVIGTASLQDMSVAASKYFAPTSKVKYSTQDVNAGNFPTITKTAVAQFDSTSRTESIDLSQIGSFPTKDASKLYILEQGIVNSSETGTNVNLTKEQKLNYIYDSGKPHEGEALVVRIDSIKSGATYARTTGPKVTLYKEIAYVNGTKPAYKDSALVWKGSGINSIGVLVEVYNAGNDINEETELAVSAGEYFLPIADSLLKDCYVDGNRAMLKLGSITPGQKVKTIVYFSEAPTACANIYDKSALVPKVDISYMGHVAGVPAKFEYADERLVDFPAADFKLVKVEAPDAGDVTFGKPVTLTMTVRNGLTPIKDATIALYAVLDKKDTVKAGEIANVEFDRGETRSMSLVYAVPIETRFLEFFAKADPSNEICEFCEGNNTNAVDLSIQGPKWIVGTAISPNPVGDKAVIKYKLPRAMRQITIKIYDTKGDLVGEIPNCPIAYGENEIEWIAKGLPPGMYILNFKGINEKGENEIHYEKAIK